MERELERLLLVLSYARRHPGAPLAEVARAAAMDPEELREKLPLLSTVGRPPFSPADLIEIWIDRQDRVFVELDQSLGRPLRLTREERAALKTALAALAGSGAGPYAETAREVIARLDRLDEAADEVERVGAFGEDEAAADRFRTLDEGRRARRKVEIVYFTASRDQLTKRTVAPYALLSHRGAWYAVAHDDASGEVRVFKLERVREARLTDEPFAEPAELDPARYLERLRQPRPGRAKIRFFPPAARLIAEEHPGESEHPPDGSVILTRDYERPEQLAGWVLAFGEAAEIVEPSEARAALAARCRETLKHYEEDVGEPSGARRGASSEAVPRRMPDQ